MSNKYCYRLRIDTIYQDDTEERKYLDGIYIDFDKAVDKADKVIRDMLKEISSDHEEIKFGNFGRNNYWTNTYLKNHPKIEYIWVEVEYGERILGQ